MRIFDIFRSLQGESTRAGLVMDFVRLAGCDLKCAYCDTAAARDFNAGREMTIPEILYALPHPLAEYVEITGGEPAHQAAEVNFLAHALIDRKSTRLNSSHHG
jgi:7-carboxy-7-deazaguanine synthase